MFFISFGIVLVVIALTTYYFSHRPLVVTGGAGVGTGNTKNLRKGVELLHNPAVSSIDSKFEKLSNDSGNENNIETEIQESDSSENSEQPDLSRGTTADSIAQSDLSEDSDEPYQSIVTNKVPIVKSGSSELKENLSTDKDGAPISESVSAVTSKPENPHAEDSGESLSEISLSTVSSEISWEIIDDQNEAGIINSAFFERDIQSKVTDVSSEEISTKPDDYIPPVVVTESILLTRQSPSIPIFGSCEAMPKQPPPVPPKPKSVLPVEEVSFKNPDTEGKGGNCEGSKPGINIISTTESNLDLRSRNENLSTSSENDNESVPVGRMSVRNLALNLKINPLALLPGSKPGKPIVAKIKSLPDEPQKQTQENALISPQLLTNVSKNRVKILRPRRPPTRKPRSPEADNEVLGSSSSDDGMNIDISRSSEA